MRRIRVPVALGKFLRDEDRAATVVIDESAVLVVACFTAAVLAMVFMK